MLTLIHSHIPSMAHYLPLSRVARLVGISRVELQRMVKQEELATFDGQVELDELLRVFPDVRWQDDGEYDRVEEIKRKAFGKRVFERALPDKEVLAERLFELGKEFAAAKSLLRHYDQLFTWLDQKLDDVVEQAGPRAETAVAGLRQWLRRELAAAPEETAPARRLLTEESVMRIMSAHVTVQPSGHEFFVEGNDTLLEAALRAGIPLRYGCSNGNCGDCRARVVSGQVRQTQPHDYVFKETDKAAGMILLCSATPVTDVVIEAAVSGADDIPHQTIPARVKAVEYTEGGQLAILHLTTPRSQRLRFLAGQRVNLASDDGAGGEYPVASCPCDDRHIEVHIPRDHRPFAARVFDGLAKEDTVVIDGPRGDFVIRMESRRPVVFVAWGAGFAPVKSLIQHAMSLEMAESMRLYWVAGEKGHYQDNLCRSWTDALDNFSYQALPAGEDHHAVAEAILADAGDLSRVDFYAAGPEGFLRHLRDGAMARGLSPLGWHGESVL